jgi:hypothetical protein
VLVAQAYVSQSTWVARCPMPDCPAAEHYGRKDGFLGGLRHDRFLCNYCGLQCAVEWPSFAADIERLLAMRPIPSTRNWLPGETLVDLLGENIEHGVIPPGLGECGRLRVTDTEILEGAALLPGASIRRLSLERSEA